MDDTVSARVLEELCDVKRMLVHSAKKRPLQLPDGIQRSVRQVIRKLKEDEENPLVLDFERFENNDVKTIVREVRRAYKDFDWGHGTVEEAVKRVWRNLRDEMNRQKNDKVAEHRRQNKSAKRKRDKLKSRITQLERDNFFDEEEKKNVRRCLIIEATSPTVTDDEDDVRRVSIPFVWESSDLREIKRDLDRCYKEQMSAQSRRQRAVILRSDVKTVNSPPPKQLPRWAVSSSYKHS